MFKIRRKKFFAIISSCLCLIIALAVLAYLYYPSYFVTGSYQGVEYYKDGSYSQMGHGFKRYGKIAAEYFPTYEDFSQGASSMDFVYDTVKIYFHLTAYALIYARYEDESNYLFQRTKVQGLGEDFGGWYGQTYLLVDRRQCSNGENVYYIVGFCDLDRVIWHMVCFETNDGDDVNDLWISYVFLHYLPIIHPKCEELKWSMVGY